MGLPEAMAVLAEDWDDVQHRLRPDQASRLRELTAQFAEERDPVVSANIAERIMDLLTEELPLSHPVLQALMAMRERFRGTAGPAADREWFQLAEALQVRLKPPASSAGPPGTSFGDQDDDD
jgi:hypothetical protein